jgi:phosphoenolpyruvate carboxylase
MNKINERWTKLEQQLCNLLNKLEDVLKQWEIYHKALGNVTQVITETEYLLSRYTTVTGDVESFKQVVDKLKVSCCRWK